MMQDQEFDPTQPLPSWQGNPTPFQSDDPQGVPPGGGEPDDSSWLDAESPGPMPGPVMAGSPGGPTGPVGPTGPDGRSVTGTRGSRGTSGAQGTRGTSGPGGPRGSTGPKGSVIKTRLGNIVWSCFEGGVPMLFYYENMTTRDRHRELRPKFLESIVPGSAEVGAIVSDVPCVLGASIHDKLLYLDHNGTTQANVRVMITGVHKTFPNWDMPEVSEEVRQRSENFFQQEWKGPK